MEGALGKSHLPLPLIDNCHSHRGSDWPQGTWHFSGGPRWSLPVLPGPNLLALTFLSPWTLASLSRGHAPAPAPAPPLAPCSAFCLHACIFPSEGTLLRTPKPGCSNLSLWGHKELSQVTGGEGVSGHRWGHTSAVGEQREDSWLLEAP